jgi:hypothetical protein
MSDIERGYGVVTPTLWYKEEQCSEGRAKSEIATVLELLNVLAAQASYNPSRSSASASPKSLRSLLQILSSKGEPKLRFQEPKY